MSETRKQYIKRIDRELAFAAEMAEWCKHHPKKCGNDNTFFKNVADNIEDYQRKAKAAAFHPYPSNKLRESLTGIKTKTPNIKTSFKDDDEKKKKHIKKPRVRRSRRRY